MSTQDDTAFFRVAGYILGALTCLVVCLVISANLLAPGSPPDPLAVAITMERIAPVGQSRMVATQPKPAPEPTIAAANDVRAAVATSGITHTIKMLNSGENGSMVFEPGFVRAEPGDTIVFEPVEQQHNTKSVLVPDCALEWQGDMNERIELTLNEEGIYIYLCEPHLALAMAGVIQVGDAVNIDAAKTKAEELTATFAMGKDRLPGYLEMIQ